MGEPLPVVSDEEINAAFDALVRDGLAIRVVVEGEPGIQLTAAGIAHAASLQGLAKQ